MSNQLVDIIDFRRGKDRRKRYSWDADSGVLPFKPGRLYFTRRETIDLMKSWLVLSLCYMMLTVRLFFYVPILFLYYLPFAMMHSLLSFVLHELAHKIVAIRLGFNAHYKSDDRNLMFGLLFSLTGFLVMSPGAVWISGGPISRKQNGIIALAGPATNICLAVLFYLLNRSFPLFLYPVPFLRMAYSMNAWLAMWNLLPFGNMDGKKIFSWNPKVHVPMLVAAIFLVVLSYL